MTETEVKILIKNRINDLLNARNTTMRNLSRQLGFSDGYINQVMNNDMMPSLQAIIAICEAANMPLRDFFDTSETYPLEYYRVNEEVKKMSADRLKALYILISDAEK